MPELNFKITGDDSEYKKTLENVAKLAGKVNSQIAKEMAKNIDDEAKLRGKVVKVTQDQKRVSVEVVNSVNEETKAIDRSTEAIKRKKGAFDSVTGLQIKPVQMSSTLDEVNASNQGKIGTISTGTVVGPAEELNKAASQATAFGAATVEANKVATEATNKTTEAIKNAVVAQNSLKLQLQSFSNIKGNATDPAIIAEYNKKIAETQAEIAKLNNVGKRGFDELGNRIKSTIGQQELLTTRLKYFQDQLQYAKAPQSFVTLNQKIQETENQLNRLANAGKKGFDDLGNKIKEVDSTSTKLLNTLKGIGAAILAAFSVQVIVAWLKEAREIAARGEGIREAFMKLGDEKTLQGLRKATRGATSDIDLMAAALRAKNFKIAPELLAKGLELAGKVSRQTGQDVTYLADSFVNGLGRKSLLILDNLQISQVQLRAEIKKTGDFQTAVGNVIEEKLKSMGDVSMTTADKMAQFATRIANIKEMVGQKINLLLNYDSLREANKEFLASGLAVASLQRNISPLLDRYEELSAKAEKNGGITKLNKEEQSQLKDIIKQVGEEIPGAVTQFDELGKAMGISTTRAREFIEQQVLVMKALNADRIKESWEKVVELSEKIRDISPKIREITSTGTYTVKQTTVGGSANTVSEFIRKATDEEVKSMVERNALLRQERAQTLALYKSDSGEMIKGVMDARDKANPEILKKQIADLETKRKALEKDSQQYADYTKKIISLQQDLKNAQIEPDTSKAEAAAEAAAKKNADKAQRAKERQDAADAAALSSQESLQQRIQVLKDKFERQGLTKEQEARRAIVDEFKKLAFDIEQQGRKYDAYAKKYGQDRALAVLGPKQTTEQIEPIRKAAIDDLVYRQETAKLELSLTKQRDLYEAFENWKRSFGEASAKRMFGNELDVSTTYLKKLQDNYSKLIFKSAVGAITGKQTLTGGEQDRLASGRASFLTPELAADQKRYATLLNEFRSFEDTKAALTDKYNADFLLLQGKENEEKRALLTKGYQQEFDTLIESNFAKTEAGKRLSQEVLILTQSEIAEQIRLLEGAFSKGTVPAAAQKMIVDLKNRLKIGAGQSNLNALQQEQDDLILAIAAEADKTTPKVEDLNKKLIEVIKNKKKLDSNSDGAADSGAGGFLASLGDGDKLLGLAKGMALSSDAAMMLSEGLGGVDTAAGYTLDTIGKLTGAAADLSAAIISKDPVKMIGSAINAVGTLFSIGKKVKEMNAAARKEVTDFYAAAIKGESDYQALLRKRDLDNVVRGKNSYRAIIDQLEALKKQSPEIQAAYDKIFDSLQGGSSKEGTGYQHGTWLRKAKTWDIMASLAGSDYDDLAQKDAQGKLVGTEKTNFDSLKALHDELEAAGLSAEELKNQLGELLTGTSTSQLADGLKSLFENGKRSAQDFGDSFEDIMKNALLNSFQAKYLEDALQPFYDELATMMQNGTPTAAEIEKLKQKYIQIGLDSDAYLKNIEAITGKNLSSDSSSSDSLKGRIESITATQADVLAGHFAGFRLTQLDTNNILRSQGLTAIEILSFTRQQLDVALKIESNTAGTMQNTSSLSRLENIENALVSMNKKMDNNLNGLQGGGR